MLINTFWIMVSDFPMRTDCGEGQPYKFYIGIPWSEYTTQALLAPACEASKGYCDQIWDLTLHTFLPQYSIPCMWPLLQSRLISPIDELANEKHSCVGTQTLRSKLIHSLRVDLHLPNNFLIYNMILEGHEKNLCLYIAFHIPLDYVKPTS